MKNRNLMRSLMFVPAHNDKLLNSALRRDADVLLLDVEDSVPLEDKETARNNIIDFVTNNTISQLIFPRINDRESGHLLRDVSQLAIPGVDGFMYPKATRGEDIYFFGKLLETIEFERGFPIGTFKIIPLIETASAVINIAEICQSCQNRIVAVAFGCEDYVTDLQGKHDLQGNSIFVARSMIAMAARAVGVKPIDTVHIRVHDLVDLERNLEAARMLGFEGMLVLNPKELPLVHQYFTPSSEEVCWATEMIRLAEAAQKEGQGVAVIGDKFVGPPMVRMAENILSKISILNEQ